MPERFGRYYVRHLMFKCFLRKFLGNQCKRAWKNLMICFLLYAGLHVSDLRIPVAPFVLYLIASVHTAGVMWRALSSQHHAAYLKNMRMLPFIHQDFVLTWVCSLGIYTLVMQTGPLLSVIWAVAFTGRTEILKSIFCAIWAIAVTAVVYSKKTRPYFPLSWAGVSLICILLLQYSALFLPVTAANILTACACLAHADADAFFPQERKNRRTRRTLQHCPVIQYLIRYLIFHPNYLVNTLFMWGIACMLPLFFFRMEGVIFFPIGFAVLSLNTPLGILLSCDPDLEQAIRFLPEQGKRFCIPYGIFVFLCNLSADIVFLCSWRILKGSIPLWVLGAAVLFSIFGAAGSVSMEWFYPIRNWKIESDLWHHPRKYVVPVVMLLVSGIFCIFLDV